MSSQLAGAIQRNEKKSLPYKSATVALSYMDRFPSPLPKAQSCSLLFLLSLHEHSHISPEEDLYNSPLLDRHGTTNLKWIAIAG